MSAKFVGVVHMHGCAQIIHDLAHACPVQRVNRHERRQSCFTQIFKDCTGFGQNPFGRDQCRHPAFWINRQIVGPGLFAMLEVNPDWFPMNPFIQRRDGRDGNCIRRAI